MFSQIYFIFLFLIFLISCFFPKNSYANNDLWNQLNSGWPRSIEQGLSTLPQPMSSDKSYILIFSTSPALPLDLRSPDHLRNYISSHVLDFNMSKMSGGHFMVGWQCKTPFGVQKGMTGLSGERSTQANILLRNGWGLNAYLAHFMDGYLQIPRTNASADSTPEEISFAEDLTLQWYFNRAVEDQTAFSFFVIQVDHQNCARAQNFVKDFTVNSRNPQRNFSILASPERFEGGGCITFAETFLKKAGIFLDVLPNLWRHMRIDASVLGHGRVDSSDRPIIENTDGNLEPVPSTRIQTRFQPSPRRPVSIHELFNKKWAALPGWESFPLSIMDPELFILYFRELGEQIIKNQGDTADRSNIQRYFQARRSLQAFHANGADLVSVFSKIDKNYDLSYGGNAHVLAEKAQQLYSQGRVSRDFSIFRFLHGYGILIEQK